MSTPNIGSIAAKVFDIVRELEQSDQLKVFKAVYALCDIGQSPLSHEANNENVHIATLNSSASKQINDPASYLAHKAPQSKMELLAVAARYRELYESKSDHSKEDFATFFSTARKNFDHNNFAGDMRNAKNAGFFVKESSSAHSHKLSYNGQNYVDSLPDKEKAASQLKKTTPKKKAKKATK